MPFYTVHGEPPRAESGPEGWPGPKPRPPVLVKEGFSSAAFLLGPVWFAFNRLWWEALALLVVLAAAVLLLPDPAAGIASFAIQAVAGLEARDRLRARLARQGKPELGVVIAPDLDIAWARLVQQRPDLVRAVP